MRRLVKTVTTLALAALLTANLFTVPVSAQTNVNKSVDNVTDTDLLDANDTDLTIGLTGKYQLRLSYVGLSEEALKAGFAIVDDDTISFNGKEYPVEWVASDPSFASVTSTGLLKANKLTKYEVEANAVVSQSIFVKKGIAYTFDDNVIATVNVTVVPEADLQAYYLGVWVESAVDDDARHLVDYAVNSANVEGQLKVMSDAVNHAHTDGTSFDVIAYTKTDNDLVRAYITTYNAKAGNHYYILTFSTTDGVNEIKVHERDYCDDKYTLTGLYYRDQVVE